MASSTLDTALRPNSNPDLNHNPNPSPNLHPNPNPNPNSINIVVEGCAHGELDAIYASIRRIEEVQGIRVDLLICCGDFQAIRGR